MKPVEEGSIPSFTILNGHKWVLQMCDMVEGIKFSYSKFVVVNPTVKTSHFDANASQIMKIINITAISEIKEPIDEIIFHVV